MISPSRQPAGKPARYQRSVAGGVGSLIVLVLVVLAFVVFRGVFRDNDDVEQEPVDYLAAVQGAQQSGVRLVYPPTLPKGWTATSIAYTPGERPAWGIGMLTDDGKFVGVRAGGRRRRRRCSRSTSTRTPSRATR